MTLAKHGSAARAALEGCIHCGGHMIPSQFADGAPTCLLCGRDGVPTITATEAEEMRKQERAGLGRRLMREWERMDTSVKKGRPPGSKKAAS